MARVSLGTALRLGLATGAAAAALSLPAIAAWACIGVVGFNASPTTVQPGDTVTLTGRDWVPNIPVLIHLDSLDGPVIFTVPTSQGTVMTSRFTASMPLPPTVSSGKHVLIASQDAHSMNGGNPARALIYVGTAPVGDPAPAARPAAAVVDPGLSSVGTLALIAAAAAVFAFLALGALVRQASHRPEPNGPASTS